MDSILWKALADPGRRRILEALRRGPRTTGELCEGSGITRYGVMKHLAVLVEAGLVRVERKGRERHNHLVPGPLRELERRWLRPLGSAEAANEETRERSFFDLYAQGFVRAAVAVPQLALADPARNAAEIARLYRRASDDGAAVVVFPELALSGYSLDDLLQQDALLNATLDGLAELAVATASSPGLLLVGAPLCFQGRLLNCAVALGGGRPLGVAPKTYLPNYREFYEKRHFTSARELTFDTCTLLGEEVPVGNDLLFRDEENPDLCVHAELCEDVWSPIPPSTYAAFQGATVLCNLSASNITIGKSEYRRQLAAGQSAKILGAYLYAAAGQGESTTDLAWDGHAFIYEDGRLLAESERFADNEQLIFADIDLDHLRQERSRMTSWIDCAAEHAERRARVVPFRFVPPARTTHLRRSFEQFPYVPSDESQRAERCYETYSVQIAGLAQRLRAAQVEKVVIGVSGGLDSTQALLVCARTMDRLGLPRENVLAYTLTGYATSEDTRANAWALMESLGVSAEEIDIRPSCQQMFADIGHPFAEGRPVYDVTFENVQAGQRTSHLFRLANLHGALVCGTGDLSELALGWCTYGVGDQMSHYNVNTSIPKTLIRWLIEWESEQAETKRATGKVLRAILGTEISPELVPAADGRGIQSTEDTIGPYELHDFDLYYTTRRGYSPTKIAYLFAHAWSNDTEVSGPGGKYPLDVILRWQREFLRRFFQTSQFKRSASPNGPKVGSGGSLSPRGDWRAPSDSSAAPWLAELDRARAWIEDSGS